MRTTITIDDGLLEHLKQRAARRGTTVSRLIEESVRLAQRAPSSPPPEPFELVTFGRGGHFTKLDIDDGSSLQELADFEEFGPRRA